MLILPVLLLRSRSRRAPDSLWVLTRRTPEVNVRQATRNLCCPRTIAKFTPCTTSAVFRVFLGQSVRFQLDCVYCLFILLALPFLIMRILACDQVTRVRGTLPASTFARSTLLATFFSPTFSLLFLNLRLREEITRRAA